jgi:hypothetical protein
MPNWCENTLTISLLEDTEESRKQLKDFSERIKDKEEVFNISKIFPIPTELIGTTAPSRIVANKDYEEIHKKEVAQYERAKKQNIGIVESYSISKNMSKALIKKYGYDNWYNWCISNWGTKWDVSESSLVSNKKNKLVYYFNTAWSPPLQAIEKISESFPLLKFSIEYIEEGAGFRGEAILAKGKYILTESEDLPEDYYDDEENED